MMPPCLLVAKFESPVQPRYWPRMASDGTAIRLELKRFQ